MWPGFPQLKQESCLLLQLGILAFPFPLVKVLISISESSSEMVSKALTSMALGLIAWMILRFLGSGSIVSFDQYSVLWLGNQLDPLGKCLLQ